MVLASARYAQGQSCPSRKAAWFEQFCSIAELSHYIAWSLCRYLSTHRYNISLMHLVDQIASPYPKALMEQRTSINLDAWPTPQDYYYNIREGRLAALNAALPA